MGEHLQLYNSLVPATTATVIVPATAAATTAIVITAAEPAAALLAPVLAAAAALLAPVHVPAAAADALLLAAPVPASTAESGELSPQLPHFLPRSVELVCQLEDIRALLRHELHQHVLLLLLLALFLVFLLLTLVIRRLCAAAVRLRTPTTARFGCRTKHWMMTLIRPVSTVCSGFGGGALSALMFGIRNPVGRVASPPKSAAFTTTGQHSLLIWAPWFFGARSPFHPKLTASATTTTSVLPSPTV